MAARGLYWIPISQKVGSLLDPYLKAGGSLLVLGTVQTPIRVLFGFAKISFREAVVFADYGSIKGLDVTGPPSKPQHFRIRKGWQHSVLLPRPSFEESNGDLIIARLDDISLSD